MKAKMMATVPDIKGIELVGRHLQLMAINFGAERISHIHGNAYAAYRTGGTESLRMLADEGIGSVEGEEGFEEAWHAEMLK